MYPGQVSKCSEELIAAAATIYPKSDIVHVTDTTSTTVLSTIAPPIGQFSTPMFLINRSGGDVTTTTAGNIQTAITIGQNVAVLMTYSKVLGKWVVGALA